MKIPSPTSPERPALAPAVFWKAAGVLGLLVFLMFIDALLVPGTYVLANGATDMFLQIYSWREFGFEQLRHGNIALWNPHVYGGAPYFGGMQGATLYPVNLLLLFLPLSLPLAINWSIAINVWLLGVAMYAWAGYRGLKPLACFVAGVVLMFCGPHFLHVYSGHPVHMASMTWAPVIFLAIDGIFENRARFRGLLRWGLVGIAAVALQILAGHPQYLFYTGIAAGLYTLWGMIQLLREERGGLLRNFVVPGAALAAIYAGGSALAAVQLFTAFQANAETIRSIPVPFEFAAMFGFPPENLLTLLNPYFFGDMRSQPYWGRCYLWEMSLFIGASGLALAVYGAVTGRKGRGLYGSWRLIAIAVVTFILALGVHTPLFRLLYDWVPGFGKFRGLSKFTFPVVLMLGMLVAIGFDALLRSPSALRRWAIGIAAAGMAVLLASGYIAIVSPADWQHVLRGIEATHESYLPPQAWASLDFADKARTYAAGALALPGFILLLTAALFFYVPRARYAAAGLALLVTAETFLFSLHTRETFDTTTVAPAPIADFLKKHPGDYRSLNLLNANSALSMGALDLWGADPGVGRRYAEFITWTQGGDPDKATQYVGFQKLDPLYAMLRLRYAFVPTARGVNAAEAPAAPMDRVQLLPQWKVIPSRDALFSALRAPGFDPRREAILEKDPGLPPTPAADASGSPGTVRITASSTDWLEIEADAARPSILLVTDAYTPAWRATALPESAQPKYELLPANYVLRGVPLAPGHHRVRIEYAPRAFTVGAWVSIGSLLAFLAAAFWSVKSGKKESHAA